MRLLPVFILCLSLQAADVLRWDTNQIGSPVSVYRAELLGTAAGETFALPALPSGVTVLAVGQGTSVAVTNLVTITNWITATNWIQIEIRKTNFVTITNYVTGPKPKPNNK